MATVRLIPSAYTLSSTQYLTISDDSNLYTNTDSTTYAQITHNRNSTTAYYLYIHGFNFGSVPSDARVTSFTVKIKGLESGLSTNSSYRMSLYNSTTSISNTTVTSSLGTTATTFEFPIPSTLTWSTINGYGNNFRIRVPLRRNSQNTSGYVRIYGAEIEVTYAEPSTITTSLTGNGTIEPSGTNSYYNGDEFELVITPSNVSDTVTATKNGVDITSSLVHHAAGQDTESQAPSEEFTTGFSSSSANFYQSSSTTGTSWLEYAIGHTAQSPYSTSNTSNTYVKPEGSTGWINYHFDFSGIPSGSTITNVSVTVYGARENATVDSTHVARFQCYSGSTPKGTIQNFTSTSNGSVTVSDVGTWTASELHDAQLRFEIGYYGGRMLGITWAVTYTAPDHYTYTYIVDGNATIAVVIGGSTEQPKLFVKQNGSWVEVTAAYKKVNGSWVVQSDLTTLFQNGVNYKKG